MDLPNLLSKFTHQQEEIQHFVAVEIALNSVKTAIWQVYRGRTEIVALGGIVAWDYKDADALVAATRKSLALTGDHLVSSTKQVIFGLPESWADADGISDERKSTLKNLCSSLSLSPVGFVVTTESMVHYLRDLEGGPPSAILIFVMKDSILVSLVRLGILQGVSQLVGRSDSIGDDVAEGLARFAKSDTFPSRMVLYDGQQDLEHIRQELLTYDWQSKLDFLHFPKIELLESDASIKAVALSGGAEVAKSMGIAMGADDGAVQEPESAEEAYASEETYEDVALDEDTIENSHEDEAQAFGFTSVAVDDQPKPVSGEVSFDEVVISSGDAADDSDAKDLEPELVEVVPDEVFRVADDEASSASKKKRSLPSLSGFLSSVKQKLTSIKPRAPRLKGGRVASPPMLTIGIVLLLIIGVGGGLFYWYVPKATIDIYVARKSLEKPVSFVLDPERKGVNLDTNTIPGNRQEISVEGSKQIQTTGTRTVGERASGNVVIFNRTSSPKTLPAGTTIESGALTFTLNDEVRIASASTTENPDLSITTEPAKQEVAATAEAIGSDYNVRVDTEFSVANFARDSFIARSVTDFTGGSSREVAAVSAKDVEQLKDALIAQLTQEVTQKLTQQTEGVQAIVDDEQQIDNEEYSHEIGEEAASLSLSMSVQQIVYTYDTKDLSLLAQQQVLAEIPNGFSLQPEATTIDVTETEVQADGTVAISARTQLKLVPDLDEQEIARTLVGKYPPMTEDYFRSLPSYVKSEIEIAPSLPARLNTFPRSAERISITIVPTD